MRKKKIPVSTTAKMPIGFASTFSVRQSQTHASEATNDQYSICEVDVSNPNLATTAYRRATARPPLIPITAFRRCCAVPVHGTRRSFSPGGFAVSLFTLSVTMRRSFRVAGNTRPNVNSMGTRGRHLVSKVSAGKALVKTKG